MSSTSNAFHVCIVGLSVANMTILRQACRDIIPSNFEVHWVSVSDPALDFLIIDADFIQARSIQNILSYHPVPVLKIVRYPSVAQNICDDTLYLPLNNPALLKDWIDHHLFNAHHQKMLTITDSIPIQANQTVSSPQPDWHIFERLHGKTLGLVKLIDARGILGVADTAQELFWPALSLTPERTVDHTLGIAHSTSRELQEMSHQSRDLKQSIWNLVWHSPSYTQLLSANDCIKLLGWPQPAVGQDRHDVLQLSAHLQQRTSSVEQLAKRTHIEVPRVQLFASALIAAGLATTVPAYQTGGYTGDSVLALESVEPTSLKPRGFLAKLRQQFGL